jgi:hypothetical protein
MAVADFKDQIHIDKIRERLWTGREIGHAAVMVGAGFSLNAEKIDPAAPRFALWREIAEKMHDELYPAPSVPAPAEFIENRLRVTSGLGALRLAEQYKAAYGRERLDDLIIAAVPDSRYEPGLLHRLLLRLPWADVLTTNFDTLLERARTGVYERRYDLVQTAADIPGRARPRIIKLHGSFPSHRPFIFTDEDYRTYPTAFPVFVNSVQQAMMENVFCLIGFSGDDPNFLKWTGWVRDNLGESRPYIYLCGLLNLSPHERLVLYEKRVIPIDLSPLISLEECPDRAARHSRALEWFLRNLERGAPPSISRWPEIEEPAFDDSSPGVPPIPQSRKPS